VSDLADIDARSGLAFSGAGVTPVPQDFARYLDYVMRGPEILNP
jgi:hypothetical protein